MDKRGSGILLHITSLPSPYGIGDFGPGAYRFVDFLRKSGQSFWQILPLSPVSGAYGNSPYSSSSAFAGKTLLISPEILAEEGLLSKADIQEHPVFLKDRVNYNTAAQYKNKILDIAFERNKEKIAKNPAYQNFCIENSYWLDDYTLFIAIKRQFDDVDWSKWPEDIRDRKEDSLAKWKQNLEGVVSKEKFLQYIFFKQWHALKNHCTSQNIEIIGDMPIYVNYDSADVWANPGIFKLDINSKKPAFVAGVPPDYFCATGQLWGHPVYNWDVLKETGYAWWIKRIEHNLKLFHTVRLDHFRGFVAYWEIGADEKTAINGRWVETPVHDFFNALFKHFEQLPIIAEDLGFITQDVREVMDMFGFPGMKVLIFSFGKDITSNPYAPHNHVKECVVYTGTHDNNTIKGWFKKELKKEDVEIISEYIGRNASEKNIHWEIIRLAMMSVADTVIIPMQDILGLGEKARMNLPSTTKGNWEWRLAPEKLTDPLAEKLAGITRIYGR